MLIDVFSIMYNEERMVPWFLRYYEPMARRIVVYDDNSTDRTRELLQRSRKVEIRTPSKSGLDDEYFAHLFSTAYRDDRGADWVICVDADEFIWAEHMTCLLRMYKFGGVDVVNCHGYEMKAQCFPDFGINGITDVVKNGKRTTWWSAEGKKPCVFNPKIDITFYEGRHGAREVPYEAKIVDDGDLKLLHYRDLGYEYYKAHHDRNAERLDPNRREKGWGIHNFHPMSKEQFDRHVLDVEQVIP